MHPRSVRAVLERADAASELPRLGGMARANGVVIVSERFWAFAASDGSLSEGLTPRGGRRLRYLPLVRGLARLAASVGPLARGRGVASVRERALLLVGIVAPLLLFLLPPSVQLPVGLALTAGLVAWLLRGRTLHLHGAEHRAIAAAEGRRLADTWAGRARPTRFARRCGTNFAALALPVAIVGERVWPLPAVAVLTPLVVVLLSLALTMEVWQLVQTSERRAARILLLPGLALQRLTTREPELEETRLALVATAAVLRRELSA
jgi:Protein of unknown function (DUF1385)